MGLGVLTLGGDGHVAEGLLVSEVFEGGHHVGLEIIPTETELLVALISRHLEIIVTQMFTMKVPHLETRSD